MGKMNDKSSINGLDKKQVAQAYEKYADQFTPKPKYFFNSFSNV